MNNSLSFRTKKMIFSVWEPPHLRTFIAIHSYKEPKAPVEALQPLAWGVGGVGKECVWAGRSSGWKRDEAVSWRETQGKRVSLNSILERKISIFYNNLSHRTGCTGIHAGWQSCCNCPADVYCLDWCLLSSSSLPAASLVLQIMWQLKCSLTGSNVGQVFGAAFWSQRSSFQIKNLSFYIKRCYIFEGSPFNGGLWLRILRKGFYPSDQECSQTQAEREKGGWWLISLITSVRAFRVLMDKQLADSLKSSKKSTVTSFLFLKLNRKPVKGKGAGIETILDPFLSPYTCRGCTQASSALSKFLPSLFFQSIPFSVRQTLWALFLTDGFIRFVLPERRKHKRKDTPLKRC